MSATRTGARTIDPALMGARVRRTRERKGQTQADVARAIGLSLSYVSKIEAGQANPTLSVVADLADALGVGHAWLLGLSGAES